MAIECVDERVAILRVCIEVLMEKSTPKKKKRKKETPEEVCEQEHVDIREEITTGNGTSFEAMREILAE